MDGWNMDGLKWNRHAYLPTAFDDEDRGEADQRRGFSCCCCCCCCCDSLIVQLVGSQGLVAYYLFIYLFVCLF